MSVMNSMGSLKVMGLQENIYGGMIRERKKRDLGNDFWMSPKLTSWEGDGEGMVREVEEGMRGNAVTEGEDTVPAVERWTLLMAVGLSKFKC